MNLLVDIGNSRVKWACHDARAGLSGFFSQGGLVITEPTQFGRLLDQAWKSMMVPDEIVAVNVAGRAAEQEFSSWVQARFSRQVRYIRTTASALGVVCGYPQPERLGADRWVAAVAAWHRAQHALCVVDCGTAVTLDAVDSQGRHLGGLIAPGAALMRRALIDATAGIPDEGDGLPTLLATDTRTAVASGAAYAVAGFVQAAIAGIKARLGDDTRIFLTGGGAGRLAANLPFENQLVPNLVFEGLALFAAGDK